MPRYQVKTLSLDRVRIDGDTQMRSMIDSSVVSEYAAVIDGGMKLPHVVVYFDGTWYWLADGFHRWHALRYLKRDRITCEVHKGSKEEAQWYAVGTNQAHGLRRTNEDKEKAVKAALMHPKGTSMTDNALAAHVGVSHPFVGKLRKQMEAAGSLETVTSRTGKDGRTIDTAKIGKKTPVTPPQPEPGDEPARPPVVPPTCPNCGSTEWKDDDSGFFCRSCLEPLGQTEAPVDREKSPDDLVMESIEEMVREQWCGRLAVAAARLEALVDRLREGKRCEP